MTEPLISQPGSNRIPKDGSKKSIFFQLGNSSKNTPNVYVTIRKKWHLLKNLCFFFLPQNPKALCCALLPYPTHPFIRSFIFTPSPKQANAGEADISRSAFPSRPRYEKATILSLVCTLSQYKYLTSVNRYFTVLRNAVGTQ